MEPYERARLESLPEPVVIYRGVSDRKYALGMSWTDDIDVAALFAWKAFGYHGSALVLKATVSKQCVLAYYLEHENEVVINPIGIEYETVPMLPAEMQERAERAKQRGKKGVALEQAREFDL